MKKLFYPIAFTSLFAACAVDGVDLDEDTGEESSALTGSDPCAIGTTPNTVSPELTDPGDTFQYKRLASYATSICPVGERRITTIVDFQVPAYAQHQTPEQYDFFVQGSYTTLASTGFADSINKIPLCFGRQMSASLQRQDPGGAFTTIVSESPTAAWVWDNQAAYIGHCSGPMFEYYRDNILLGHVETGRYRVRAWAKNADDSLVTVTFTGAHGG